MRRSNELSLGDVIKQFIKANNMEDKILEVRIRGAWEKVMGAQIHSLTERMVYREKGLTVYLRSAPLREELSMARTKIMDLLNKEVKQRAITELHFR
jgi:predicted nucleic acid-binding Zn ribbon protein